MQKCVFCDFTVDDSLGEMKTARAMFRHLASKHPDKL